jgi:ATP-dependent Lon protease
MTEQTPQTPKQEPQQPEPTKIPDVVAVLPLKGTVVLPSMVVPLGVGRPKSLAALEAALAGDRVILLVAQKKDDEENPEPAGLYHTGTVCRILQVGKQADGTVQVVVEGVVRGAIVEFIQTSPFFQVRVEQRPDSKDKPLEVEALMRGVTSQFERFARLSRSIPPEAFMLVMSSEEPGRLGDLVAQHLQLKVEERQRVLDAAPKDRLEMLSGILTKEINILELERKIQNRVRKQMEKSQREYFLKEQMKAIQQELGEKDERTAEVDEYRKKIEEAKLPEKAKEKALEELGRLEKMPPMVAEAVVVRTYLDWILALPWSTRTDDRLDIKAARHILDEDHYGLEKARIGLSSTWLCARWRRIPRRRSSASSARPAWGRPLSASRSRGP